MSDELPFALADGKRLRGEKDFSQIIKKEIPYCFSLR